jgi:hypothetical protein
VKLAQQLSPNHDGIERRSKPRIYDLFRATVHGVDSSGEVFEADAVLDNLSAAGLYIQLGQCVDPGATLAIIVELSPALVDHNSASRVVLYGTVLRAELKSNDACGVAMRLSHHRFL